MKEPESSQSKFASTHPQQNFFEFGPIKLDSRFDSGNLAKVSNPEPSKFDLWISADGLPYPVVNGYRVWFYFSITGVAPGATLNFSIKNMSNEVGFYFFVTEARVGYLGLASSQFSGSERIRIGNEFLARSIMSIKSTEEFTYFALSYPFTYQDSLRKFNNIVEKYRTSSSVYVHHETAVHTIEGRAMQLLTVSSFDGITGEREELIPGLFPEHSDLAPRPFRFNKEKPCVFLTARVHPGELPASYMLNGLIDFILGDSEQSKLLRKHFVFKIIPILNPDGVYRGYYRLDTKGQNLNRYYSNPTLKLQPTIYATKQLILQQHQYGSLKLYIDFHAHAGKRGSFLFGNSLRGPQQVENVLFAKLVSLNSINFDFAECTFTEQSMTIKDKRDGLSREGAGRVAIYKETGLSNCYTLECNYHSGKRLNYIPQRIDTRTQQIVPETPVSDVRSKLYEGKKPPAYNPELFEDIGRAVGLGLLDYFELNQISRVPMSTYKSVENMRKEIGANKSLVGPPLRKSGVLSERLGGAGKKASSKSLKGKSNYKGPEIVFVSKKQKENGNQEVNEEIIDSGEDTRGTPEEVKVPG